jgi:hypothetical protein
VYFDIGKQKLVWILKCREQHEEAAVNALTLGVVLLPLCMVKTTQVAENLCGPILFFMLLFVREIVDKFRCL